MKLPKNFNHKQVRREWFAQQEKHCKLQDAFDRLGHEICVSAHTLGKQYSLLCLSAKQARAKQKAKQ